MRAHPRSRGENSITRMFAALVRGSSPLTRGKHRLRQWAHRGHGLIPAHAGKTYSWRFVAFGYRAHPRSRGENTPLMTDLQTRAGSSPLTRGKPTQAERFFGNRRLIPAHAGKTSSTSPTSWQGWAHPRSRGENATKSSSKPRGPGSSPLTRGKLFVASLGADRRRLIPAHAGKTRRIRRRRI